MNNKRRLLITSKDIMIITDRSERYGRRQLKKIRRVLKKQTWQPITFEEFCQYMALDIEKVYARLGM